MANRILLGNISGAYGLKVSKPGYDVTTAHYSDILFDSTTAFYRVRATYTFTIASGGAQQVVTHNIGSVPLVLWSIGGTAFGTVNEGPPIFTTPTQLFVGKPTNNSAYRIRIHLLTEVV